MGSPTTGDVAGGLGYWVVFLAARGVAGVWVWVCTCGPKPAWTECLHAGVARGVYTLFQGPALALPRHKAGTP